MKAPSKAAIKSCTCPEPECGELYWLSRNRFMACRNWSHGKLRPIIAKAIYGKVARWLVFARRPVAVVIIEHKGWQPMLFILDGDRRQTFMLYRPTRDDANPNTRVMDARRKIGDEWRPCKLVPAKAY